MKIGLVAPPWIAVPPPTYGGIELIVDLLARGFRAAGHDVLLFSTGDSTCPVPRAWVYEKACVAQMGSVVTELRHLIHAYKAMSDVDLVHDHTVLGPLYAERSPSLPVVTTNHGLFDDELSDIYREVAHRVPVIAISRHQALTARDIAIARVIHHGLDPEAYPVGEGRGGYLAFLGRMAATKGVREAVLIARRAGVPLVIAAKMRAQEEHEYFDSQVRPLLGGDIEYIGEVGGVDKLTLLGGAKALLNPIHWPEPFGLVMVEALACGTPVISSVQGSATEIIEHGVTGFLCADERDLVGATSRLDTIDRRACRAAVEGHFSMNRMVADYLDLFGHVLDSATPRTALWPRMRAASEV